MPVEYRGLLVKLGWTTRWPRLVYVFWTLELGLICLLTWWRVAILPFLLWYDLVVRGPLLVVCIFYVPVHGVSTLLAGITALHATLQEKYTVPPRFVGWKTLPSCPDAATPLLSALGSPERPDTYPRSRLCRECINLVSQSNFLSGSLHPLVKREEWLSWPVQHAGVNLDTEKKPCHLCNILWDSLGPRLRGYSAAHSPVIRPNVQRHKLWLRVWREKISCRAFVQVFGGNQRPEDSRALSRTLEVTEEMPYRQFVDLRLASSTGSFGCMELANHWFGECTSTHGHCSASLLSGMEEYLPSRLLSVARSSSAQPTVYLQDTSALSDVKYLALSYVRSSVSATSIDQTNSETSINETTLPLSFQQAITLSRRLGFNYLWIDALCIPADGVNKSAERVRAFASATCTISACASRDPSGGCFRDRAPQLIEYPCCLRVSRGLGRVSAMTLRANSPAESEDFNAQVEASELGRRGYALQERLLSRRVLHFGPRFVFFECGLLCASEGVVEGVNIGLGNEEDKHTGGSFAVGHTTVVSRYRGDLQALREGQFTIDIDIYAQSRLHRAWFRLVSKATTAYKHKENEDEDRGNRLGLVDGLALAIAGENLNQGYIHGLWRRHLVFDLLWFIGSEHTKKPRPQPREPQPSWSWAAVDGTVRSQLVIDEQGFEGKRHVVVQTATQVSVSTVTSDGESQTLLVLKCPLLRATNIANAEFHFYTVEVQSPHGGVTARYAPDTVDYDQCHNLVCAELLREIIYEDGPGGKRSTAVVWSNGLVLRRVEGFSAPGHRGIVFQRVGRFWMQWPVVHVSHRNNGERVFGNGMVIRVA